MEYRKHFAKFDTYCPHCEFKDKKGDEEPCDECLCSPAVDDSRVPVNYKGKKPIGDEW